ncbi:flagellar protein FlbD [Nocardioides marmoriginsengisoli]|uniref:Flagellar protein FlbD n=1 Tax=Nocardioides marmoriginsengisoli TaxID=661483 RepID=A0A3N0CGT8_9ACTN|nr:flagellar FlbD family protein [Nocardioides marmoriginsengisoli]RNL62648.1 flagellar protein FlbD [Nocardioides marmoriginsengisoli]
MITLTRLSGSVFVLNSDLIERIDATPDSVITLVDGKKYVVSESLDEIIAAVRTYRGQIVAVSSRLADAPEEPVQPTPDRPLAAVATLPSAGTSSAHGDH